VRTASRAHRHGSRITPRTQRLGVWQRAWWCLGSVAQAVIKRRECSLLFGSGLLGTTLLGVDLLAHEFTNGVCSLLSVDHHAEATHVVEISAFSRAVQLLGGAGLLPLLVNLGGFPELLHGGGSSTTVEGNLDLGESKSAEGVHAAGEGSTFNENALAISPVDNKDGLAVILSEVNESESTSLNKLSKRLKNRMVRIGNNRRVAWGQSPGLNVDPTNRLPRTKSSKTYHFFFYITILNNNLS
jgi:hypothetical protein